MDRITPGFPVHHQHLKLVQTHVHRVSDAVQPSHLLPSPFPPAFFPRIKIFSNESVLHIRWPNYWSFNFSISPSHEYSALTSMRLRQNKPLEFRFSPAEKAGWGNSSWIFQKVFLFTSLIFRARKTFTSLSNPSLCPLIFIYQDHVTSTSLGGSLASVTGLPLSLDGIPGRGR